MTIGKRSTANLGTVAFDVWRREIGELSTRNFAQRLAASEDLVLRLDILRKLDKHRGCVNTVGFNATGDILISGSDDRRVILWDWETGRVKLSFFSGHENNVFQAMFMPYTEDRSIVTCAADGQVRHAQIHECGVETKLLTQHQGRAHKLAIEPGSPHIFYSCGEDGLVQHIDLRSGSTTSLFTCRTVPGQSYFSTVHLNAITIDQRNPNLFAVGGADQFARLFDIRKCKWGGSSEVGLPVELFCPAHLVEDGSVGITGLAFSEQSELLVSYNDEFIYLFTKDMGLGPHPSLYDDSDPGHLSLDNKSRSRAGEDITDAPQAYKGHNNCETVKGVGFFGPRCDYVVSGSDCGRIFIWKKKGGELVRVMEADKHIVNCIEAHPHATVLASSGLEHDIKMWIPKAIESATLPTNIQKDRALSSQPRTMDFFRFGIIYDEDEDQYDDDDLIYSGDNDEDGDNSSDDVSNDDDEDDGDCDSGGNSQNNDDYVTCDDEIYSEGEVSDGHRIIEENNSNDNDNNENSDSTVFGVVDDNENFSTENFYGYEFEEKSGDGSSGSEDVDSFVDIYDDYCQIGNDYDDGGDSDDA